MTKVSSRTSLSAIVTKTARCRAVSTSSTARYSALSRSPNSADLAGDRHQRVGRGVAGQVVKLRPGDPPSGPALPHLCPRALADRDVGSGRALASTGKTRGVPVANRA